MVNPHIASRLDGICNVLCSAFEAGKLMSSASKGYEREIFISLFLNTILPPIYRFGTGDITDAINNSDLLRKSGQIDIVIEMPWAPSFPVPFGVGTRLYPAEAVGTAIEVKSNLINQWNEVKRTANSLEPLRQKLSGITVEGGRLSVEDETMESIPLYAVGYEGWSSTETVKDKLRDASLDGILILNQKIFVWSDRRAFLLRLHQCQVELTKVSKGISTKSATAACARAVELIKISDDSNYIVSELNKEDWFLTQTHFGDQEFLPQINAKGWTLENFESFRKVFMQKTKVSTGIEALVQFISVVHHEVGKRSAMSFDLFDYSL